MDSTHLHLILNHFPIVGTLIGTIILLYGLLKKNTGIQQVGLGTIAIMALIAIPVFLTGEPAGEKIENLPGIVKASIETHEEAAEVAYWVMLFAGLFAGIAIAAQMTGKKVAKTLAIATLFITVISFGLMARTGYLGGQIRHSEITGNSIQNQGLQNNAEKDDD